MSEQIAELIIDFMIWTGLVGLGAGIVINVVRFWSLSTARTVILLLILAAPAAIYFAGWAERMIASDRVTCTEAPAK